MCIRDRVGIVQFSQGIFCFLTDCSKTLGEDAHPARRVFAIAANSFTVDEDEMCIRDRSNSVSYLYSYLYSKLMDNCAAPSIRYLSEHYDLPITVNQLAEMENYNVTYYNDWFKQQTGCSPSLYLRRIRIERAKELLLKTHYSMMDIAIMVGYSSNSTFTRAFHSITGMTPKLFREANGIDAVG